MIKKKKNLFQSVLRIQFIRFVIAGCVNTAFGYGVFALFIYLKFQEAIAFLFSTILGVLFNFKTVSLFVFRSRDNSLILKFMGVYALTYILSNLIMMGFNYFRINKYISGAIIIIAMGLLSFYLNKKYVFRQNKSNSNSPFLKI